MSLVQRNPARSAFPLPFPLMALFLYDLSTPLPAEATPVPLAKIDELWMRTSELAPLERLIVLRSDMTKSVLPALELIPLPTLSKRVLSPHSRTTTPFVLFAFTASELLLILLLLMVTAAVPPTAGCTTMPPPMEGGISSPVTK